MFDSWDNVLCHHGVRGQKWGIRRYQNPDGTLTAEGKARYYNSDGSLTRIGKLEYRRQYAIAKKLSDRANINKQAQEANKYNKRSKLFGKMGLTAAGVAGLGFGGNEALRRINNKIFSTERAAREAIWESDRDALDNLYEKWNSARKQYGNYSPEAEGLYNQLKADNESSYDRWLDSNNKSKADAQKRKGAGDAMRTVGKIAMAGTAISAGLFAYNKIKAHAAEKRITEAGHSKAVKDAEAQIQRMENMFGNVPIEEILKRKS